MLKVKTIVKESSIQGLGLFAAEEIPKGTIIWEYDPQFDISFTKEEFDKMDDLKKSLILIYAYLSDKSGEYIYSIDDSRFTNHSSLNPNEDVVDLGSPETAGVANRDIHIGEEILVDYKLFDAADAKSNEEYLNS